MNIHIQKSDINKTNELFISGSKSESNRLLLLQALFPEISLQNVSNSDDSQVMMAALKNPEGNIDIHHAGTAMRFLTAFFASKPNANVVLSGSARMHERPIKVLVDALKQLGAEIEYLANDGFPPLKISGKALTKNIVNIPADVSSQYISALMLMATKLPNGIILNLEGQITSVPYINMTLALLNEIGAETSFENNKIEIKPISVLTKKDLVVESDWSSASYFYSIVALSPIGTQIKLSSYKENSLQGDSDLATLYQSFGVQTTFDQHTITLEKISTEISTIDFDLNNTPDIAQTIAVTCLGLGVGCHLTGLHTLKIKETDRLVALQNELGKLGANVQITNDSLTLLPTNAINSNISIETYNDHRMAMAFAPLALHTNINILDANVVTKSFPNFWNDLAQLGFHFNTI